MNKRSKVYEKKKLNCVAVATVPLGNLRGIMELSDSLGWKPVICTPPLTTEKAELLEN
jgi:hypothetical protein